jgi:hypothetical protein
VYPNYKTLQPDARAIVHDPMGHPVQSARVTLISNSYPYGREKSRETKETDIEGSAKFESKKEWRTEMIMIHGAEVFFWNWCVEKPGFKTYLSTNRSADRFSTEPIIVLKEGVSTPCPAELL